MMLLFYGKLLLHPGHTYFGAQGDGMQIYYETLFHIKFDTAWWSQNSVNYPYGESIFFTGAMPFVNNLAKLFGTSAGPLGVAIINLMMIFSPVIGALFIYAIFRHLRLPWHYGGVCATFIAYLSPQLLRMYGHYSLQWVFLIPAMFYLLLRFYDQPSVLKSFTIAFLVFLGASTHLYFLAFFGAIGGAYWAILFLTRDRGFGRFTYVLKHAGIQFVLPVLILQTLVIMSDHVADRTIAPWGFLFYHSNFSGVFFPSGKIYEEFFRLFSTPENVDLEGIAYVGIAAIIGFITIIIIQLVRLFRGRVKLFLEVSDNKVLNIFFWTSLVMLWFSFGHPFVGSHEDWLPYLGPIRQFRSVGRFTWVFFYIINIIAVYRLYKIVQQRKVISYAIMLLISSLLFIDAYSLNKEMQDKFNNHISALDDEMNLLPENAWMKNFNAKEYQAILPLPYFHIGSENLCRPSPDAKIVQWSYVVSLKTGLPLMGVASARVSLGQTANMVPLVLDPILPIPVLKDIKDTRPLLIVVREELLDEFERKILSFAKPIGTSTNYKIYSLDPAALRSLPEMRYNEIKSSYVASKHFSSGVFSTTDSAAFFIYHSFDHSKNKNAYRGDGAYEGKIIDNNVIFDSTISIPGNYVGSFWFNNMDGDIYPRMTIEVFSTDPSDKVKPFYFYSNASVQTKAMDGHWGLIEFPLTVVAPNGHVKVTVWNREMKKIDVFQIDELLIRPATTDLYLLIGDTIIRNTRTYFPHK